MGGDEIPIDHIVPKERVDMVVVRVFGWAIEPESFPVADTRHQFNSQQVGQSKNREVLSLGIRVNSGGLDSGLVAHKNIQDVDRFPHTTRDKVTKEQNIQIAHMMIGNAAESTVPDMFLCQQILFGQFVLRAISGSPFLITPIARQGKAVEPINNVALGSIQIGDGEVTVVEVDNLVRREDSLEMTSHLLWAKMGPIGKDGEQVPFAGIRRFWLAARERAEMPREVGDMIDARQYIEEMPLGNPFRNGLFQLHQTHRGRFDSKPLESRLPFLIDNQFMVVRAGAVYFRCDLSKPSAQMLP